jgi:hypothetical protein
MWGFKGNEEKDEDVCMAAADIKIFSSKISNAKKSRNKNSGRQFGIG